MAGAVHWTVRRAAPGDGARLAAIHAAAFDAPWSSSDFEGWLARGEAFSVLVSGRDATDDETRDAAFALALAAGDDAELLTIASTPRFRRRGAARAALAALDAEAKGRGLARWVLDVAADNASALGLYVSLGFVDLARRPRYYARGQAPAVDARVMACGVGRFAQ